jgi:urease accessory protein
MHDSAVLMSLHQVGREGELRLTFANQAGRTVLTENYSRPPLQVMRAISDNAQCLCIYLLSPTGGVVQGDRYHIRINVGADTHALFTTQSATKVYKMPDDCAQQLIRIEVERGAIFEFVPDAAILFADSDLRQHIEVKLRPGALLLLHEVIMPGRFARGEHLQFRRYINRIVVRDDNGLLLHDAATIEPSQMKLDAIGVLEGYRCWGSAYLLGDLQGRGIDAGAFCEAHARLFERPDALGSISPLYRSGIGVRMVSQRLETIYAAFSGLRQTLRTQYLHLPDAPLRK